MSTSSETTNHLFLLCTSGGGGGGGEQLHVNNLGTHCCEDLIALGWWTALWLQLADPTDVSVDLFVTGAGETDLRNYSFSNSGESSRRTTILSSGLILLSCGSRSACYIICCLKLSPKISEIWIIFNSWVTHWKHREWINSENERCETITNYSLETNKAKDIYGKFCCHSKWKVLLFSIQTINTYRNYIECGPKLVLTQFKHVVKKITKKTSPVNHL
jgi:hypothetical protein